MYRSPYRTQHNNIALGYYGCTKLYIAKYNNTLFCLQYLPLSERTFVELTFFSG